MIFFRASAAFSLGLERTGGFETVAFCEIEPFPQRVLKKHWPKVPIYDDVKTLTSSRLVQDGIGQIDVITGGFPCQDISTAGKQAGMGEGTRSGLWSEIVRLISELRPRYVIVENVANLLSGPSEKRGGWFGRILGDLAEIGHDAEWHCIPAGHIGASHERDRIWIVAYAKNQQRLHQSNSWETTFRLFDYGTFRKAGFGCAPSSGICRVDDGLPYRVDRTASLGNAVVPQIPELIGNAILSEIEAREAA